MNPGTGSDSSHLAPSSFPVKHSSSERAGVSSTEAPPKPERHAAPPGSDLGAPIIAMIVRPQSEPSNPLTFRLPAKHSSSKPDSVSSTESPPKPERHTASP